MNKKEFLRALADGKKLRPIGEEEHYVQLVNNEIVNETGAVLRGGAWLAGAVAGVFGANLYDRPSNSDWNIGLRCADVNIEWEIIKQKQKIKLYRHTYRYEDEICAFAEQSNWTTYTWNEMPLDKDNKLLDTETKEIEIEDSK